MEAARRGTALVLLILLTGCGTGAVFETDEQRQARIDAAVQDALQRQRGWQTRFVERRTETLIGEQQALAARMTGLERMAADISGRLDAIDRGTSDPADYVEDGSANAAGGSVAQAEVEAIRLDIAALSAAIAQLSSGNRDGEAAVRARLERLELRTSKIAWPAPSSAVKAVHLASYRSHEAALAGWEVLSRRYRDVLADEIPTLIEVRTVAGEYVRLFTGSGQADPDLLRIRDTLRDGGDYAMILPLPGNKGS